MGLGLSSQEIILKPYKDRQREIRQHKKYLAKRSLPRILSSRAVISPTKSVLALSIPL